MKFCIAFFSLLLTLTVVSSASGQTMQYDSLAVDSVVFDGVTDPQNVLGIPDSKQAAIMSLSGLLGVEFFINGQTLNLHKGAELHFYWIKETSDSCGGFITFLHLPDSLDPNYRYVDTALVMEGGSIDQPHMTTLIVPDTGINNISLEVAGAENATLFYIDAIILKQSGFEAVASVQAPQTVLLSSYPNPFEHSSREAVHIEAPTAGRGALLLSDALGREVERVPIGELHAGGQDVSIGLDRVGIFFARLLIEGTPVGPPLKLVAE